MHNLVGYWQSALKATNPQLKKKIPQQYFQLDGNAYIQLVL